jgi:hypothetical protein
MTAKDRAAELIGALEAQGLRGYVNPSLIAPPCLLFTPPSFVFDLACQGDATWRCPALAPSMQIADESTWEALDQYLDAMVDLVDLTAADLVAYTVNGRVYPAYLLTWQEPISIGEP